MPLIRSKCAAGASKTVAEVESVSSDVPEIRAGGQNLRSRRLDIKMIKQAAYNYRYIFNHTDVYGFCIIFILFFTLFLLTF